MMGAPVFQVPLPVWTAANPIVHFSTSEGDFEAEIYLDRVPITASNFIALCRTGFYDGLHVHRIIDGFMVQFGCPFSKNPHSDKAGKGSAPEVSFTNLRNGGLMCRAPGGTIRDEYVSRDSNVPGSLSMANVGQPDTGSSQIFLNVGNNSQLDWFSPGPSQHLVFGMIKQGFDVVTKISKMTIQNNRPETPVKFIKVTVSGAPEAKESRGPAKPASSSSSSSSSSSRTKRKSERDAKRSPSKDKRDSRSEKKDSGNDKKDSRSDKNRSEKKDSRDDRKDSRSDKKDSRSDKKDSRSDKKDSRSDKKDSRSDKKDSRSEKKDSRNDKKSRSKKRDRSSDKRDRKDDKKDRRSDKKDDRNDKKDRRSPKRRNKRSSSSPSSSSRHRKKKRR